MTAVDEAYDRLVRDAVAAHREGWDFSWLDGRTHGSSPSWSYSDLVKSAIAKSSSLLDIDTGGGELLASLAPLPPTTVATEGWGPNVPIATERLASLSVEVIEASGDALPGTEDTFDLVLNRHGRLNAAEVGRVLKPGGRLVTQQVGSDDCEELNALLGTAPGHSPGSWTLEIAVRELKETGFTITNSREEWPEFVFDDVGAVVFQLEMVTWQIPDFDPHRYEQALRSLHARIVEHGALVIHSHRFLIDATL